MTDPIAVGSRIRELRRALGWTQGELAERANVHKNTVLHAEKSGRLKAGTLIDLARALGVDPGALFGAPGAQQAERSEMPAPLPLPPHGV